MKYAKFIYLWTIHVEVIFKSGHRQILKWVDNSGDCDWLSFEDYVYDLYPYEDIKHYHIIHRD